MGSIAAAAVVAGTWVILCAGFAAGLHAGYRLWVMLSAGCDWADAGAAIRARSRRKYGTHRKTPPRPVKVPPGLVTRSDRLAPQRYGPGETREIPAVRVHDEQSGETMIITSGPLAPSGGDSGMGKTETFARPPQ
jgi:hypothetical protein